MNCNECEENLNCGHYNNGVGCKAFTPKIKPCEECVKTRVISRLQDFGYVLTENNFCPVCGKDLRK